jgi:hypothetical protein
METGEQIAHQGRAIWVIITGLTMVVSLGLNIAHAVVYQPVPEPGAVVVLSHGGRVFLGLLSGVLPVVMAGLMSHTFFTKVPAIVRVIVTSVFLVGMGMSLSAQYELFEPAVGWLRAVGTVAVIDVPALLALGMIERGNRAQAAAERLSAARAKEARERAERERRERLEAERLAIQQAAAERLAIEQKEAAQAAERAAERELQAAAERSAAERLATERAAAERLAAEQKAAAELAETERLEAERIAADKRAEAERASAARMEAQRRAEAERRETERQAAERQAAAELAEAERQAAEKRERAAERKAAAELAERGDIPPAEKKRLVRELYLEDNTIQAPAAVAAVVAKGGQLSAQRARAILAEVRQEEGGLAEVRQLTAV